MIHLSHRSLPAASGFTAVILGAFGAHLLQDRLSPHQLQIWETAVFYQFIHTLVLLWLSGQENQGRAIFRCFTLGIIFFSGSLYLFALLSLKWLVVLTPIGGLFFAIGWFLLFLSGWKKPAKPAD